MLGGLNFHSIATHIRRALGTPIGSDLVGFAQAGAGAVAETIMDALRRLRFAVQFGTLAQAVTACDGKTLYIDTTVNCPANLTIPGTVALEFKKGGKITVPVGVTLTVYGHITAPDVEIFSGDGTVSLDSSPNPYNLAWFETANGYINERWDFAKRGMATFRSKVVRVPRPYSGQAGALSSSGRMFWEFDDEIVIEDDHNCAIWFIEAEFSAAGNCAGFLRFDDANKPENIYFYGPLQAIAAAGTIVDFGINMKAGSRIHFFGQVVLNGFQASVKLGGPDQSASVGDIRFLQLQCSFFTDYAVQIYGKATPTAQGVTIDVLEMTAAQVTGVDPLQLKGLLRNVKIGRVSYSTDVPKNGYAAEDADNVVLIESNDEGDILHCEIGSIYQANATNGLKVTSTASVPVAADITSVTVGPIFGDFGGSAADIDYCHGLCLLGIENNASVTIGSNAQFTRIDTSSRESSITDNGAKTIINGMAKQTRGTGLPPAPSDAWPIGTTIRETSDGKIYRRIAKAAVAADFIQIYTPKNVSTTQVGNVGAGEDNLQSYQIPANVLTGTGVGFRVTQHGTIANNANAKTLKSYVGATAIVNQALTASVASQWRIVYELYRTGANTQKYAGVLHYEAPAGTWIAKPFSGTLTETDTAAITLKCTGEATSNNDIVQEETLVEGINL